MKRREDPERRKYPRADINFIVSYRIKEEYDNNDLSQGKNVSQGGMLLTTNRKFERGVQLVMAMRFPFLSTKKIKVLGEVLQSKEVIKNLIYETRIRFFGLEEALAKELNEFIKKKA